MNAHGKDGNGGMKRITVSAAERAQTKPKYGTLAAELLAGCREFYKDPENEKAFREWKERKEKKGA